MTNLKPGRYLLGTCMMIATGFMACNNSTTSESTMATDSGSNMSSTAGMSDSTNSAIATLTGTMPDTTVTGTVKFEQNNGKVKMMLQISIPKKANQTVAVHIHENGACGDMGKAAGGHWNPTNQNHGKWGSANFHLGDIGNVDLDGSGNGTMEMETDLWSIGGDANKDVMGKGIIVHGGKDDYTTQPTGNAGSRIGCGVISKSNM